MNRGKVSPLFLILVVVVILVVVFVGYSRRSFLSPASQATTASERQGDIPAPGAATVPGQPGKPGTPQGVSSRRNLAQLGIAGKPSQGTNPGLLVTGFDSKPENSPLGIMGVKKGDVIISCNGEKRQMGLRIENALKGLQEKGEKITLVVVRDGKEIKLERTEKLPATVMGNSAK